MILPNLIGGDPMNTVEDSYKNLAYAVIKDPEEELLPIEKGNIKEIDAILRSLDEGRTGHPYAKILTLYFGLDGEGTRTLDQIGNLFGVSKSRIMQLRNRALQLLGHPGKRYVFCKLVKSYLEAQAASSLEEQRARKLKTKITELDLPVRAINSMKRGGIETIGDLVRKTAKELRAMDGCGKKTVLKIKKLLGERGLALAESQGETKNRAG